tara:strand:+ start:4225 stop:4578 length:354 start_codon:yes stop_codon:yes gene_type:complete
MSYELKGTVTLVNDTQTFDSGFTKRELVVNTGGEYPQEVKLEMVKDNCAKLDNVKAGQEILATFDVRGNEYNGKYYVNLLCWKFELGSNASKGGEQAADNGSSQKETEDFSDDGIPF